MFRGFIVALGIAAAMHSTYPAAGIVTGVIEGGPADDIVVVTTSTGIVHIGQSDDLMIGDIVAMIMDNNGTPDDIRDDIILDMRYTGFTYEP